MFYYFGMILQHLPIKLSWRNQHLDMCAASYLALAPATPKSNISDDDDDDDGCGVWTA
jgi:hypothetical protein